MTVGLSRSASTMGALPAVIWRGAIGRRERELEAVGNPGETIFDRDACHAALRASYGFNKSAMRGRMPHLLPRRSQAGGATITDRSSTALAKS
jgi:hypothetical protein